MSLIAVVSVALVGAGPVQAPHPASYILRVDRALQVCRQDIPAMQRPAEEAARLLVHGGHFYAAGQPSWVSEMTGRAGGFMMLVPLGHSKPVKGDVVLYAQEQPGQPVPRAFLDSKADIVAFGEGSHEPGVTWFSNHAAECDISPTLANAIPAWLFSGELVAALTRQGKMPVMWESIGTYTGPVRGRTFEKIGVRFHKDFTIPPVAPGVLANRYCDRVSAMLDRVEAEERAKLDEAGAWCAEAKLGGKRLYMYSMGHLFPDEVGKTAIGKLFRSHVWNAGFRTSKVPNDPYSPGDAVVHIGYQHPPLRLLRKAVPAGARVCYVSVMRHRDYVNNPNVIWIDPMWPWEDACVPLKGYEIPILPASGVVNGAIAWEIYRVTMKDLGYTASPAAK